MTPLTEDGRAMVRSKCGNGWADPECSECHGTGIGGGYLACDECFLGNEDVLTARDYCPALEEVQ